MKITRDSPRLFNSNGYPMGRARKVTIGADGGSLPQLSQKSWMLYSPEAVLGCFREGAEPARTRGNGVGHV
jgi:hypothetical protein